MELELISVHSPGNEVQKIAVNEAVFNCDYNEGLIHQVVVALQARQRSGNSAQKTRAEVSGGGIKPWRQKGTGGARAGTIRSPLWRKGGVIFAAKPRDYEQKINKKMYRKAFCSILSELNRQGRLIVCDQFVCDEPRAKAFKNQLALFNKHNNEVMDDLLIICEAINENVYLATRNFPRVQVVDTLSIDLVDLIRRKKIVVTANALKMLDSQLSGVSYEQK